MAKIRDEELRVTVTVNGDSAQKKLMEMEAQHLGLVNQGKALREQQAKMLAFNKEGTQEFKKLTQEIKTNTSKIKESERQMDALRESLDITSMSARQLENRARNLSVALRNTTKNSPERKQMIAEYNQVTKQLEKLEFRADKVSNGLQRMADKMNRYQSMMFVVSAFAVGLFKATEKITSKSSELADAISMVEKTTNLTNAEVIDLIGNFKNIDTRTPRMELLKLAEQAGRLGKRGKKDILEFTKQADYIKVALGDDLKGNTEDHIRLIGKLTDLYAVGASQGMSFGEGMQMIGSAINEVSNAGTAQAGFLVDYLKRLSGVSLQAKLSAQDQLGFAAVLDESGKSVEVSGTAMSKVFLNMFKDTETYSKIAGISVTEFGNLLKTDANEAMLLFLKGLNGNNEGLGTMTKKLDGLGIDGARSIGVLTALAGQTDKIREKQNLANKSLQEGTSIINEFSKKNENFAATVDKLKKKFFSWLFDSKFVEKIKQATEVFAQLVGVSKRTKGVQDWIDKTIFLAKVIGIATVGVLSYKTAVQLAELWTKRATVATWLKTVAEQANTVALTAQFAGIALYNSATLLMTGRTKQAAASFRLFTAALNKNPFILVATLVTTVTAAYFLFREEQEKLTRSQVLAKEVSSALTGQYAKEKQQLETLHSRIKNVNLSQEDRLTALAQLKEKVPGLLDDMTLESSGYLEMKTRLDDYLLSKERELKLKVLDKRSEVVAEKSMELDFKEKEVNEREVEEVTVTSFISSVASGTEIFDEANKNFQLEQIKASKAELKKEQDEINKIVKDIMNTDSSKEDSIRVGTTKLIGRKLHKWNGKTWVPVNNTTPDSPDGNADEDSDPSESKEARAKERLAEYLDQLETDREIQEELKKFEKEARAEEEEILNLESKFAKLEEDAFGEKELLIRLEEEKNSAIDDIRNKYSVKRLAKQEQDNKAQLKKDKAYKNALANAEITLQRARSEVWTTGLSTLRGITKEGTALYKALFLAEKIFAASDVIVAGQRERAAYMANPTWSAMPDGGAIIKGKHVLASKIRTGISLATIAATTLKGFEDGYYPVRRKQDGKMFQAKQGGEMNKTQIVKEPRILVGETMPELIVSGKHFKNLEMNYPSVVNTIMQTAPGYENGKYPEIEKSESENIDPKLVGVLEKLLVQLDTPIKSELNYKVLEEKQKLRQNIENLYN